MGRQFDVGICLDCGRRHRVRHREWIRARQPRCIACGGKLEPSSAASEEHTQHDDAKREKEEN